VIVYPEGRYRLETTVQDGPSFTPKSKVFEDELSNPDLADLNAILNSDEFRALRTEEKLGSLPGQDWETWVILIPRTEGEQKLLFHTSDWKTSKPPKSFLSWFTTVEKQRKRELSNAKADQCSVITKRGIPSP